MQRYEKFSVVIKVTQGKRRYSTMFYPIPDRKSSDRYIVAKKNDRLDLIASDVYGDPRKWVLIAKANKLHNGTIRIPTGIRLWIPFPYDDLEILERFTDKQL